MWLSQSLQRSLTDALVSKHPHPDMIKRASRSVVKMPVLAKLKSVRMALQRVRSSLRLFHPSVGNSIATNRAVQPQQPEDTPRPPQPSEELRGRLAKFDEIATETEREVKAAGDDIRLRRCKLFESVDTVLLPLKLLSMEVSNVRVCTRQVLEWNIVNDEIMKELESTFEQACREATFAAQHLAIEERNYFAAHRDDFSYNATENDRAEWEKEVQENDDIEFVKDMLKQMFPLSVEVKNDVRRVEKTLQTLTKLRIRCKKILYDAMETAVMIDEAQEKGGVTMNALLHPIWN